MVAIAQLVEHLIVVQKVARSSRVSHPIFSAGFSRIFFFMLDYFFFTLSIILFAIRFFNLSVHVYARILVHVGVE